MLNIQLKSRLASRIAEQLLSERTDHWLRRKAIAQVQAQPAQAALTLFYQFGDANSHLCLRFLPTLAKHWPGSIEVVVVPPPNAEYWPEPERQHHYSWADAAAIAPAWGLTWNPALQASLAAPSTTAFIDHAPLLACNSWQALLECEQQLLETSSATSDTSSGSSQAQLENNRQRQLKAGHYAPGMWLFAGRWFQGLNRLDALHDEAVRLGVPINSNDWPQPNWQAATLPEPVSNPDVEGFFSFRSPYSYLAGQRSQQLAQQYQANFIMRPVLPMVMRGLAVPKLKRFYLARDAQQQAARFGIPYGRIADPVGAGAERCLQLYPWAESHGLGPEFFQVATRKIWSEGCAVANDAGMRQVTDELGLPWPEAKAQLQAPPDLGYAEQNRQTLLKIGLWGVPSYRVGPLLTWGQDRLPLVDEYLRRCQNA